MSFSRACKDAASNSAPRLPCSQRAAATLFCRQGCRLTQWRRGPLAGPALSRACRLGTDRARGGRLTRWRPGRPGQSRSVAARSTADNPFASGGRLHRWRPGPPPHGVAAGATCRLPRLPPLVRGSLLSISSAGGLFWQFQ